MPRTSSDEDSVELSFDAFDAQAGGGDTLAKVELLLKAAAAGQAPSMDAAGDVIAPTFVALREDPLSQLNWYFPAPQKDYRPQHALNASRLAMHFGMVSRYTDARVVQLGLIGLFYDIGMWLPGLPDVQAPRDLTREETAAVEGAAARGADLLASLAGLDPLVATVAREHHERADGTGYPARTKAESQHPYSRLFQLIDAYLGMIEPRAFRRAVTPVEAMQRLAVQAHRGYFHEPSLRDWLKVIGLYPIGAWVRMNSGDVAVVARSGGDKLRRPQVLVVADETVEFRASPMRVDLAEEAAFEIAQPFKDFPKPGKK